MPKNPASARRRAARPAKRMFSIGDIVRFGPQGRPHRIERIGDRPTSGSLLGTTVVMQEMAKDSLGRLRSLGEDGRFSTTLEAANKAPLFQPQKRSTR